MKKFTDEQIIKALECCSTDVQENPCPKCAFYNKHRCSTLNEARKKILKVDNDFECVANVSFEEMTEVEK